MITSDLFTNNPSAVFENTGPVTHRIGLTVTDPNHPMVSKRKEPYQKSIRITQQVPDREAAINQAIAHYRRKGYKVHDHHYIGTVDQGMAEGQLELNTPDPVVVVQDLKGNILDKVNLSVAAQKYKLGQPQNIKNQLAHQNYTKIGNYTIVSPISGQPQDATTQGVAEGVADDMAAMAQKKFPNAYISKNGQEVQKPENWDKKYTPPAAAPADLEKQQRDLTARYPNIDELVRRAELNRDPNYEYADGQAYYAARDAEQNYQKLKQIQRVIQGLNESLNRSHLP
jgi:hypothetical protein